MLLENVLKEPILALTATNTLLSVVPLTSSSRQECNPTKNISENRGNYILLYGCQNYRCPIYRFVSFAKFTVDQITVAKITLTNLPLTKRI